MHLCNGVSEQWCIVVLVTQNNGMSPTYHYVGDLYFEIASTHSDFVKRDVVID